MASVARLAPIVALLAASAAAQETPAFDERGLVAAAAKGEFEAAARLVSIGRFEALVKVDPAAPAVAAWREQAGKAEGLTPAQVFAVVLANRPPSLAPGKAQALQLEARTLLAASAPAHPMLRLELARLWRTVEPDDDEKALEAERGLQRLLAELGDGPGDPVLRGAALQRAGRLAGLQGAWKEAVRCLDRAAELQKQTGDLPGRGRTLVWRAWAASPEQGGDRSWDRAAELYAEAAAVLEEAGDDGAQADALHELARCVDPEVNPDGSWERAAELYAKSAELSGKAGDAAGQAASLHAQATCLEPGKHRSGSWAAAAPLYEKAAELHGQAGDVASQASSVYGHAACVDPDNDPRGGSWEKAIELYGRAAALYAKAEDRSGEGVALHAQATCLEPDRNPKGSWEKAIGVYARAAELAGELDDRASQGLTLALQARCFRPDLNPAGAWEKAAAAYERAARLLGDGGDRSNQAASLREQAICSIQADKAKLTPAARALFAKASALYRELGDDEEADELERRWLR